MKKLILISLLLCVVLNLAAQAPHQFSFQGVARDVAGKVLLNATISIRLTIHEGSADGATLYQETHKALTSNGGIFTVSVGTGTNPMGTIEGIKWSAGNYYLQVEMDPAGGNDYANLGATQILSVPYALHAGQADKWKDGDPVVQRGIEGQGGILPNMSGSNTAHFIWYPRKSAFRAGYTSENSWADNKIGLSSTAFGINTTASGESSIASGFRTNASGVLSATFGYETKATADASVAIGYQTNALGPQSFASGTFSQAIGANAVAFGVSLAIGHASISAGNTTKAHGVNSAAMGQESEAFGEASFSLGNNIIAKAAGSFSLGLFNNVSDNPSPTSFQGLDRIFQIGNGSASDARSNALTVLRNGKIGIGNNVLEPSHILDIGGRPRIRSNGSGLNSAGLYFDDSNHSPEGFVGMKSNGEIGFYNAKKWLFWMDDLGNAHIIGTNYNTSDRRLKRNFSSLSSSLSKLSDLNGYHYFWKDSTLDQTLQTGLIAQEVEALFPELVKTDDKGFKSVNYTGLIPHLIESVKELDKKYQKLNSENEALKNALKRIDTLEAAMHEISEAENAQSK